MSVTTYYGRLSEAEYAAMRIDPEGLAQFVTGVLPRDRLLYLDKATPVIAWLLSPHKRHEQAHFAAVCRADDASLFKRPDLGPEPPMDEILIPLEGRGAKDPTLDVGMGSACVLSPSDVMRYSAMLANIGESHLRERLDFAELDAAALPVDYWSEEGEQTFTEYILPLFTQLQAFFAKAATESQVVLVWYN
jgi:Domain of unknown function (DUF1877)